MINLYFMLDEAYSLFSGGEYGPRFGGAGLQMFFLANELSKLDEYNVHWVFRYAYASLDLSLINHSRIRLIDYLNDVKVREITESQSHKILISSIGASAPFVVDAAERLQAKSILRLSSDTDVTEPRHAGDCSAQDTFRLYQSIDFIVTQSRWQQEQLKDGVGIESELIESIWTIEKGEVSRGKDEILWVSSAQALKQPWYFLDLAESFPDEKFRMIMPSTSSVQLEEYICSRAAGLDNLTLLTSQIPFSMMDLFFKRAKLFVNTSEIEGFPNTYLQAWSEAAPVATLSIDPDDAIEGNQLGINAGGNILSLFKGIELLLSDNEKLEQFGKNALGYVEAQHGYQATIFKWTKLINNLASR